LRDHGKGAGNEHEGQLDVVVEEVFCEVGGKEGGREGGREGGMSGRADCVQP